VDVEKLRKRVAYIEELDRGRFPEAMVSIYRLIFREDSDKARESALETAPVLLDYIRSAPDRLEMMSLWATDQPDRERLEALVEMADSYFRLQADELDEQVHKLEGLLDDAYLVGKLVEHFADVGMHYGELRRLSNVNKLVAFMLGEERVARLHARIVDAGGAIATEPPPIDRRLLGVWHHKTFYESGDFSHMTVTSRLFGSDGRYVEGDQSFVGMVFRTSAGAESGRTDTTQASPSSRGSWALRDNVLTLKADTGAEYDYKAELYPDSILLTRPGRKAELWTRR
jgi:hypothetical protein